MTNVSSNQMNEADRHITRLLKLLSKQEKTGFPFTTDGKRLKIMTVGKDYHFNLQLVEEIESKRLVWRTENKISLTDNGRFALRKRLNPDAILATGKREISEKQVTVHGVIQRVRVNEYESPLMRLFLRKTKSGQGYLTQEEFEAGERLRKDFEKGQLQPRISANLEGNVGSSGQAGFGDAGDIADFALDARKRLHKASERLGPELAGVTVDICCFLKGLEKVERERHWPPRSAKLMLKTALSLLATHYGITGYQSRAGGRIKSWGSLDYRPEL
jgi:hypothetical protein